MFQNGQTGSFYLRLSRASDGFLKLVPDGFRPQTLRPLGIKFNFAVHESKKASNRVEEKT